MEEIALYIIYIAVYDKVLSHKEIPHFENERMFIFGSLINYSSCDIFYDIDL